MAILLDESGAGLLDEAGGVILDESGVVILGQSSAALAAAPVLIATCLSHLDDLWAIYVAAQQVAVAKAEQWRMMRQAGGTDGSAGFLYGQAYEAEAAADKAYENWRVAQLQAFGSRG